MANPKNYAGSFAQGFIEAFLQARRYKTLDAYYKFRMAQAGYDPATGQWGPPHIHYNFQTGTWDNPGDSGSNSEAKSVAADAYRNAKIPDWAQENGGGHTPIRDNTFLGNLRQFESSNANVPNTREGTSSGQAQGYYQITTGTWKEFANKAGIDLNKYPSALGDATHPPAPFHVQEQMAKVIPYSRWDPKTIANMERAGYHVDPRDRNKPLGEISQQFSNNTQGPAKLAPVSLPPGVKINDQSTRQKDQYGHPIPPPAGATETHAQAFTPYQTASLTPTPPPTTSVSPQPAQAKTTPGVTPPPLPPRYGDYGYERDAQGNLVPKAAPVTPAQTTPTQTQITPPTPQQSAETLRTGHYVPTTGAVRGPPTWVPDNPPKIQAKPAQAPITPPAQAPTQQPTTPLPPPRPAPQQSAPQQSAPQQSAPQPSTPQSTAPVTPGAIPSPNVQTASQDNMDDMMAMRELLSDNSGSDAGYPMIFQAGGPVPDQVVHFANSDPAMQGITQAAMGSALGGAGGASSPGGGSAIPGATGFDQGGTVQGESIDSEQPNADPQQTQGPVVSSDQSTQDMSQQVQQGAALMGAMAKQEGKAGPDVHEQQMKRQMGKVASPSDSPVQQGSLATQMNQMRYQIQNWPSIFSTGVGANPDVGSTTTATGFAAGGLVGEDDSGELPPPEAADWQMAYSGGNDPTQGQQDQPQPEQVASLGMGMGRSMGLPAPRMGMGTGSGYKTTAPRGSKGTLNDLGLRPEDASGDQMDLPQGEQQDKVPIGTPQIADQNGNPAKGLTDALTGGMKALINMFGLGGSQQAIPDPAAQQRQQAFARGEGAPSDEEYEKVLNAVDPHKSLSIGMRNLAAMEAVHNYYLVNNQPQQADQMVGSMLQYSRELTAKYGDVALQALHKGDLDAAVAAEKQGYDWTPDGKQAAAQKIGDGKYLVQQRDLNNKVLWQQEVGPREILQAALGMKSGTAYWQELEKVASAYDPVSAQNVQRREQAQTAAQEWQPPSPTSDQNATPRVSPIGNAPDQGAIPTPTQAASTTPQAPTPPATNMPTQGQGQATPPSATPPSAAPPNATPPATTSGTPTPSVQPPAATTPQPGPPVAQPGAQPATLADVSPQLTALRQQIQSKNTQRLGPPPAPTENPALDAKNRQAYNAYARQLDAQGNEEYRAAAGDIGANAREQAQLKGMEFQAVKARETQEHSDAAALERQKAQETFEEGKETRAESRKATAPMQDKDLRETMSTWDKDKFMATVPNLNPQQQTRMMGAIWNGQRFNKGMSTDDVADFVKGYATGQYRLDDKTKPKETNDDWGSRYTLPFVRSDGTRGRIVMTDEDMDALQQLRKSHTVAPVQTRSSEPWPTPGPDSRSMGGPRPPVTPIHPYQFWNPRPAPVGTHPVGRAAPISQGAIPTPGGAPPATPIPSNQSSLNDWYQWLQNKAGQSALDRATSGGGPNAP